MIGFYYLENQHNENKTSLTEKISQEVIDVVNYFSYEIADLKTLLFDLDNGVRGLGGCKQAFKIDELPSVKKFNNEKNKILNESLQNETPEERLKRHQEFFQNLKQSFKQ